MFNPGVCSIQKFVLYGLLAKVGNGIVRGKTTHHVLRGTLYHAAWRTVYTPSNDARYTVGYLSHARPHDDVPLPIEGGRSRGCKLLTGTARVPAAAILPPDKGLSMRQENAHIPEEPEGTTPLLAHIIERNIRTITRLRLQTARERHVQDRLADAITSLSGSMLFVYLHILWFGAWLLVNTGYMGLKPFDPFPYGLLTMIVSLEAIFLATFVLISQNRFSDAADRRAELDLQIGLLAEHEITRVLQMLDAIQAKLGIENDVDSELADLEMETKPEDVLAEIDRVHRRVKG
jgi:uncharacterized membrane protein